MARRIALFVALWVAVGFHLGSVTLLGPVRWATDAARALGWPPVLERAMVLAAIALLVVVSAAVAWWLAGVTLQGRRREVRAGVPALCAAAALGAVALWLAPGQIIDGPGDAGEHRIGASAFTVGPYPDAERLERLRREGYTGVVSLLHPAVVPFEPKLIADGRRAARHAGLEFVHVPMVPWVSDNAGAIERIERLAREADGERYYVHCYLGKDRVRLFQSVVARVDPRARLEQDPRVTAHQTRRRLADGLRWERGEVVEIAEGVFVGPFPTDDELLGYVLPGGNAVVSLLDPENPEDRPWIERERKLLARHHVDHRSLPLPLHPWEPRRALEAARLAADMPRPLLVHAFLPLESGRSPAAEGFVQAFNAGMPPLPPALFAAPLAGGVAEPLAPHVAAGPRPNGPEFGGVLHARGVREFVRVGDAGDDAAREDERICREAGLRWRAVPGRADAVGEILAGPGPWYLYGPGLADVRPAVAERFGPPIPPAPAPRPPGPLILAARRLAPLVPGPLMLVVAWPLLALLAAGFAAVAARLRAGAGVAAPYTRKAFHFLVFTTAGLLHLAWGPAAVATWGGIVAVAVVYATWRGEGFPFYEALARPGDAPRRTLFVLLPLGTTAAGGVASVALFGGMAHVGYLVAGWGDALAEPVGTAFGRHRYRVPSLGGVAVWRSVEGSAAVFAAGWLAATLGLAAVGVPATTALLTGLAVAACATVVEAASHHGTDNLTVQLAATAMAWALT